MRLRDNSIFELQTAESGAIIIYKESYYDDYGDELGERYTISEIEGYGGYYWGFSFLKNEKECLNYLENIPYNYEFKRSYISWWLNSRPLFIEDSFKLLLKERLEFYYLTSEIQNTFYNSKNELVAFEIDCILEWHEILNVKTEQKLSKFLPQKNVQIQNKRPLNIKFESFNSLPFYSIQVNYDLFKYFQDLLNYIYEFIKKEVPIYSYNIKWVIYNSSKGNIIKKETDSNILTFKNIDINPGDNIICYKH